MTRPSPCTGTMTERAPAADGLRRWQLVAELPRDPDGRRRRISTVFTGSSVRAARAALHQHVATVAAEHAAAALPSASTITLAEYSPRWLEHLRDVGRSPTTIAGYRRCLHDWVLLELGDRRLADIRPVDLRELHTRLRSRGLAPSSVRRVHYIVRRLLQDAVLDELLEHNVAHRVQAPSIPQHEITPPDTADVRRLLDEADRTSPLLGLWMRLHATTGARRGEICALRWSDIDHHAATITIRRGTIVIDAQAVELPTKTRTTRTLPIDPDLHTRLTTRWADVQAYAAACGSHPDPDWWILPMDAIPDHPRPWPPDSATHAFARLRAELHLGHVRLHDLRHWVVTTVLAAGVPLNEAAAYAGHSSSSTTARVYAHHTQTGLQRASTTVAEALRGNRSLDHQSVIKTDS
jgi:integrase